MISVQCSICKRDIIGPSFETLVDDNRVPSADAQHIIVACSNKCKKEFEESLPYKGKPLDHLSRVTGYYQRVSQWNTGKQQEFLDRQRYTI